MNRGGNATHGNCKEVQRFIPKKKTNFITRWPVIIPLGILTR